MINETPPTGWNASLKWMHST